MIQLLRKENGSSDGISDQDVYSFNNDFIPPSSSIRLQGVHFEVVLSMQLSYNQRCEQNLSSVVKYTEAYKAAIVKTVKKKKRIHYNEVRVELMDKRQLQNEVFKLMRDWNITEDDFRKCVEGLIESEYIERDKHNENIICYA